MNKEYFFRVAGFVFKIISPLNWNIERLIPSMLSFTYEGECVIDLLFAIEVNHIRDLPVMEQQMNLMFEEVNDMGHLMLHHSTSGYYLKVDFMQSDKVHIMVASRDFTHIKVYLCDDDKFIGESLNSMIRFAFSQAVLPYKAISVHASAVCRNGLGYLFMGKSGTGKSTHASLWLKHIDGTDLLNDDNPILRIEENGTISVYGTPWSGKTSCYKNRSAKVRGLIQLCQANENHFVLLEGLNAFVTLLPSCLVLLGDPCLHRNVCNALEYIVNYSEIVIGKMHCLPQKEAAVSCFDRINL